MYLRFILITILLFPVFIFSQDKSINFSWFPSSKNFIPFRASFHEPKMGVLYFPANGNLKVDIGNSFNLIGLKFKNPGSLLTAGVDFMAYALSTNYQDKRLKIVAMEGFFGGNISYTQNITDNILELRLRVIHNSSHLVDGLYDRVSKFWRDNREPIPYARDFIEMNAAYTFNNSNTSFRYFGGVSYSFLRRPEELEPFNFLAGGEFVFINPLNKIFETNDNIFFTYMINLGGAIEYTASHHIIAGFKIGEWRDKGIDLFFSYYKGNDIFNNYYNRKVIIYGFGFAIDFI